MIESFTELGEEPDHSLEVVDAWQEVTLTPRIQAYCRALKAASHPDSQLEEIEELAKERLRDRYEWDVVAALQALGINVGRRSSSLLGNADFGPDIWTIRTAHVRDLLLRVTPPLGLKGLVASYADANKLCFKLRLTQVNGRVSFKEVHDSW